MSKKSNNDFFDNTTTIVLLGILIILIGIAIYMFVLDSPPLIDNFSNNNGYKLEFFSMDGCGHCEDFKPIWHNIEKNLNGYALHIGPNNPNYNNLVEKFNIGGFPHIQIVDKNNIKISEWSGPREVSSIVNWFKKTANL